jgi:hypothetical protein
MTALQSNNAIKFDTVARRYALGMVHVILNVSEL